LVSVADTPDGYAEFTLENVPDDFERLLMNDQIQVGARSILGHLEQLRRLIRERQRARGVRPEGGAR